MTATTATRPSAESKAFVSFMLTGYFGRKSVREMNAWTQDYRLQAILKQVVRLAHRGEYEQVSRSFEMPTYTLGWVIETGRLNGATELALREMDCKTLLTLIGTLHDLGLAGNAVADYLMGLNLRPGSEQA